MTTREVNIAFNAASIMLAVCFCITLYARPASSPQSIAPTWRRTPIPIRIEEEDEYTVPKGYRLDVQGVVWSGAAGHTVDIKLGEFGPIDFHWIKLGANSPWAAMSPSGVLPYVAGTKIWLVDMTPSKSVLLGELVRL